MAGTAVTAWVKLVGAVVVLVLVGTAVVWLRGDAQDVESGPRPLGADGSVVEQFPVGERETPGGFTGRLLDGESFDSDSLRGRVAVFNVWGSWCGPCRAEASDLARVAREFSTEVAFVGINVRDNVGAAQAFEREYEVPYPSIQPDDSGEALLAFGGILASAAVPSTVVLDVEGRVAARAIGPVTYRTLRGLVEDAGAAPDR
jgi:thiol-disulfide isomerase/thioredoxin